MFGKTIPLNNKNFIPTSQWQFTNNALQYALSEWPNVPQTVLKHTCSGDGMSVVNESETCGKNKLFLFIAQTIIFWDKIQNFLRITRKMGRKYGKFDNAHHRKRTYHFNQYDLFQFFTKISIKTQEILNYFDVNIWNRVNSSKLPRQNAVYISLKEDEIGISEYTTTSKGFKGIIKQR